MNVLLSKCYEVIRKRVLDIIEIFVTQGLDNDARALGTYYVLGALTTVSHDAAVSLPHCMNHLFKINNKIYIIRA